MNRNENIHDPNGGIVGRGLAQNLNPGLLAPGVVLIDEITRVVAETLDSIVTKRIMRYGGDANLISVWQMSRE